MLKSHRPFISLGKFIMKLKVSHGKSDKHIPLVLCYSWTLSKRNYTHWCLLTGLVPLPCQETARASSTERLPDQVSMLTLECVQLCSINTSGFTGEVAHCLASG